MDIEDGFGGSTGDSAGGQGVNPAWEPILSHIPEDKRGEVMPHFQKWDQGYNNLKQEYEPYSRFSQAQIDADSLEQAWGVYSSLNNNPTQFYSTLVNWMNEQGLELPGQQAANDNGAEGDESSPWEAKYAELSEQNKIIAKALIQQQETAIMQQEDERLDQEMKSVHAAMVQKHGWDGGDEQEKFVHGMLLSDDNMSIEQAYEAFYAMADHISQVRQRPLAPRIMGSGGHLPSQRPDYTKMSDGDVRSEIVQRLMAAKAAKG